MQYIKIMFRFVVFVQCIAVKNEKNELSNMYSVFSLIDRSELCIPS